MDDSAIRSFGPFELDLRSGDLRRHGVPVPVQPQPARVLTALVARAGDLVLRDELRGAVWDDKTHVDFNRGLNYCIRHLRTALEDDARAPRFIETVARQGYRFVGPVAAGRPASPPKRRRRGGVTAAAVTALVLLAFAVESGGRNQRHHETAVAIARSVHDLLF